MKSNRPTDWITAYNGFTCTCGNERSWFFHHNIRRGWIPVCFILDSTLFKAIQDFGLGVGKNSVWAGSHQKYCKYAGLNPPHPTLERKCHVNIYWPKFQGLKYKSVHFENQTDIKIKITQINNGETSLETSSRLSNQTLWSVSVGRRSLLPS